MPATIHRPTENQFPKYYGTYIDKVANDDLINCLTEGVDLVWAYINTLSEDKLNYRYAAGKWTIKEILIHLMDAERIFAYRALRFARNDKTELAGFEENDYVPQSNATSRTHQSLQEEYKAVRANTHELFKNMTEEMLDRGGKANGQEIAVRALGYIIVGHELHHLQVIKERYL